MKLALRLAMPILAVFLVSGCAAQGPGLGPPSGGDAGPTEVLAYSWKCPPGAEAWRSGEVCAGTLRTADSPAGEAVAAVASGSDGPVAVAWIAAPRVVTVGPTDQGIEYQILSLTVAFSHDRGATWTRTTVPTPSSLTAEVRYRYASDPTIAYDAAGTLHVSGITQATDRIRDVDCHEIFHVATADDGSTWSTPVSITDCTESADRPWIAAGAAGDVVITWDVWGNTNYNRTSAIATSRDGGATWAHTQHNGCGQPSPARWTPSGVVVACAVVVDPGVGGTEADSRQGLRILRLLADASGTEVTWLTDSIKGAVWPVLSVADDGALALTMGDARQRPEPILLLRSTDEGRTWSGPFAAPAAVDDEAVDGGAYLGAVAADGWGGLHVVVWACARDGSAVFVADACGARAAHLVVDAASLEVLQERDLMPDPPRPDGPLVGPVPDHTAGVAFGSDFGILAWARQRGIDFTIVEHA